MPGKRDVYWGFKDNIFVTDCKLSKFRELCQDNIFAFFWKNTGFSELIGQFTGQLKIRV